MKKVKKKQITSTLNVTTRDIADDFRVVHFALKMFTKKRGANNKVQESEPGDAFSSLLDRLNIGIARIQLVLSTKQSHSNLRVQMHLLSPWVAQFERLLSNVVKILNDRVAMLWRPKRTSDQQVLLGEAFILHQDIASCSSILKNALIVLCCGSRARVESDSHMPRYSVLPRNVISKLLHNLKKLFPMLTVRVECYVAFRIKGSVTSILSNCVQNVRMYRMSSKDSFELTHLSIIKNVDENILSSVVTALLKSKCCISSKKRLVSAALSSCCDSLLGYILDKRFRFSEFGVLALYSQLQELMVCAGKVKETLLLPPASLVVQDQSAWNRANTILNLLLMATTRNTRPLSKSEKGTSASVVDTVDRQKNSSSSSSPCSGCNALLLGVAVQEAWMSLGRPPPSCCNSHPYLSLLLGTVFRNKKRKSAIVSISPVLLTVNI